MTQDIGSRATTPKKIEITISKIISNQEKDFQKAMVAAKEQALLPLLVSRKLLDTDEYRCTLEGIWSLYKFIRDFEREYWASDLTGYNTNNPIFIFEDYKSDDAEYALSTFFRLLDSGSKALEIYDHIKSSRKVPGSGDPVSDAFKLKNEYLKITPIPEKDRCGFPHWTLVLALDFENSKKIYTKLLMHATLNNDEAISLAMHSTEKKEFIEKNTNDESEPKIYTRVEAEKKISEWSEDDPNKVKEFIMYLNAHLTFATIKNIRSILKFFPAQNKNSGISSYFKKSENGVEFFNLNINKEYLFEKLKNNESSSLLEEVERHILGLLGPNLRHNTIFSQGERSDQWVLERNSILQSKDFSSMEIAKKEFVEKWKNIDRLESRKDKVDGFIQGLLCYDFYKKGKRTLIESCEETEKFTKNLDREIIIKEKDGNKNQEVKKVLSPERIKRKYYEIDGLLDKNMLEKIAKNQPNYSFIPWIYPLHRGTLYDTEE